MSNETQGKCPVMHGAATTKAVRTAHQFVIGGQII